MTYQYCNLVEKFRKGINNFLKIRTIEMEKQKTLVLASFAAAGGETYRPVQIQKLIFLFQKRALKEDIFNFVPYDYGPFEPAIYRTIEELCAEGLVRIVGGPFARSRQYKLTPEGEAVANEILDGIPTPQKDFLIHLSEWVRSLSFSELVGAVYRAYPEMRVNSIFEERQ